MFAICHRPSVCLSSVCRLSSVCNVRAPYSGDWNFRQCFYAIWYLGHPLASTTVRQSCQVLQCIDLFSCTAARVFNKLTFLLTYLLTYLLNPNTEQDWRSVLSFVHSTACKHCVITLHYETGTTFAMNCNTYIISVPNKHAFLHQVQNENVSSPYLAAINSWYWSRLRPKF